MLPPPFCVGRVLLSVMFILAGFAKLTAIAGTAGWFGSIGLPAADARAPSLVGLLELVGGLAILVGYQTRIAAIVLAVFTVAATLIAHLDFADQMQLLLLPEEPGDCRRLPGARRFGAGALSVDARRG